MAIFPWPSILIPSAESWTVNKAASRSGGRSLVNAEQIVVSSTGFVAASLTVPCNTDAKVLAMRALLAGLDGRANAVTVGPVEVRRAPWCVDPLTGGRITYGKGARDAAVDPVYATNPDTSSTLDFRTAANVALNATSMTVQRTRGGVLQPGMIFSVAGRLHMVTALTTADGGGPAAVGMQFRPWARAAWPAGTALEFGTPQGTMKLATDDTGDLTLQLSRSGTVTLDLVEAF